MSGRLRINDQGQLCQIDLQALDLTSVSAEALLAEIDIDRLSTWKIYQIFTRDIESMCSDAVQALIKVLVSKNVKTLKCYSRSGFIISFLPDPMAFYSILIETEFEFEKYDQDALQRVLSHFLLNMPVLANNLNFVTKHFNYDGLTLTIPKHVKRIYFDAMSYHGDNEGPILSFLNALAKSAYSQFELELKFKIPLKDLENDHFEAILKAVPSTIPRFHISDVPVSFGLFDERICDYLSCLSPTLGALRVYDPRILRGHKKAGWVNPLSVLPRDLVSFGAAFPVGLTKDEYVSLLKPLPKTTVRLEPILYGFENTCHILAALPPQVKTTSLLLCRSFAHNREIINALPEYIKSVELEGLWNLETIEKGHLKLLLDRLAAKMIQPILDFKGEKDTCKDLYFHQFFPWSRRCGWVRLGLAASDARTSRAPKSAFLVKEVVEDSAGAGAGVGASIP